MHCELKIPQSLLLNSIFHTPAMTNQSGLMMALLAWMCLTSSILAQAPGPSPDGSTCENSTILIQLWSLKNAATHLEEFPFRVLELEPEAVAGISSLFVQALPGLSTYWEALGTSIGPKFDEYFAAKFETQFCVVNTAMMVFRATSDDGSMLYLDEREIVSMNRAQSIASDNSGPLNITAGCHNLTFLTFQNEGASLAKVEYGLAVFAGAVDFSILEGDVLQPQFGEFDDCSPAFDPDLLDRPSSGAL